MQHPFPGYLRGYAEKAFGMGLDYFASFDGFPNHDVVMSERKFTVPIGGNTFSGIVDLVLRDKQTNAITVIDHKTKSADAMRKERGVYQHQLRIYAAFVKQETGAWPETIAFNMIKSKELLAEPFTLEGMRETVTWTSQLIDSICLDTDFPPTDDTFQCNNMCDMRPFCPYMSDDDDE